MINVPVRVRSPPFPANFYQKTNLPSCLPRLLLTRFAHLSRVKIKFSLRARLRSDWTLFALVELVEARGGKKTRVTEVKESKSAEYEIDRSEHGLRI